MPLLTCPNDNAAMQAVTRQGVEFDVCTQCRGVWLDRGELEKLLGMARTEDDGPASLAAAAGQAPRSDPRYREPDPRYREHGERGEYGEGGEHGGGYDAYGQRRKKRFDILDIFD